MNKKLYTEILGVSFLIAVLHSVALNLFLYWTTSWFDILMHFLGGFVIGLITFLFFNRIGIWRKIKQKPVKIILLLLCVLFVGLTWELWEIFAGMTDVLEDVVDTIVDVIMDAIGGVAAYLYLIKRNYEE